VRPGRSRVVIGAAAAAAVLAVIIAVALGSLKVIGGCGSGVLCAAAGRRPAHAAVQALMGPALLSRPA
jgi:hypothetical protein